MQPIEALFVIKRSIGLDEVTVNPVRAIISNIEQSLIGRERHAIGVFHSGIDHDVFAVRFYQPNFARRVLVIARRIGDINISVVRNRDVVANPAVCDRGRLTVGIVSEDFLLALSPRLPVSPSPLRLSFLSTRS